MRVTFTDVTISFEADSAEDAYRYLGSGMEALGLAVGEVEWSSGNYSTEEDPEGRDTAELID